MGPERYDTDPAVRTVDRRRGPGIGSPLKATLAHCTIEPSSEGADGGS